MLEKRLANSDDKWAHVKDGAIDLLSGTAGGIASVYAGQPLDTVKVKVQTFPHLYKSWPSCFSNTFRVDGVRGLYAGTVPALAANISENAVLFMAYGYCQKIIAFFAGHRDVGLMHPVENAISGSMAAVFAATVLCPTELVKCKLQAQREQNPKSHMTPFSICRDMYRSRGVPAFFVGMTPTLLREVPGYFFFFGAYETSCRLLTPNGKKREDIGLVGTAISGAAGGAALWTAIFPADVVKSRMQVAGNGSFSQIFVDVLKSEGIRGFYKGLLPTLIRTCLATPCLFIAYENTKRFLHSIA